MKTANIEHQKAMNIDGKIDGFVGCYLKRWERYWDADQMSPLINDTVASKVEEPVDMAVGWERDVIEELPWDE